MKDLEALIDGFARFRRQHFEDDCTLYQALRHGQAPKVMMIACSDSRVDPAILTQAPAGAIFTVRNVANLVPPYTPDAAHHGTSAALEYAVETLRVQHIIVKGHTDCGGIKAVMTGAAAASSFMGPWLNLAAAAKAEVCRRHDDVTSIAALHDCARTAALESLRNLLTFPFIRTASATRGLQLHGWFFDLQQGQLEAYDPAQSSWRVCDASHRSHSAADLGRSP